jgi:signal transduction histidine kinase
MAEDRRDGKFSSDFPSPPSLSKSYEELEKDLLEKIQEKVLSNFSLNDILETVFNSFGDILTFDRLALAFIENDGKRAICRFVRAKYSPVYVKEGYSLDLSQTTLETVFETRKPRIISDLTNYILLRRKSVATPYLIREGLRSSMITPLFSGDKRIGFLFFNSTYPNAYGERELRILSKLTHLLSYAIERAFYLEQLEKVIDSYKEILNFVSHEIKNPISSLITQARILEQGFVGELTESQKSIVQKMVLKAEYLLGLVKNYLDLSKIEQGKINLNKKVVKNLKEDVISEAISYVMPQIQDKKMIFSEEYSGDEYEIELDPNLIKIVLTNLLGNGVQYGREGGKLELSVKYEKEGIYISVMNEGEGFTEEEKSKLFRKFSRLETSKAWGIKGTGLGLYITWWIISEHKGWIDAESEYGKYARFKFFIPKG